MKTTSEQRIILRHQLRPGDLGRVVEIHGEVYAQEFRFDYQFEAYVALTLGQFALGEGVAGGRLWLAEIDDRLVGSIGIVLRQESHAQLRWLVVHPEVRGLGLGSRLIAEAIEYSRGAGCGSIYLWTVNPLTDAARLYEKHGFRMTQETQRRPMWGSNLAEQCYDREL